MPDESPPAPSALRAIAAELGISERTVLLALRGDVRIAHALRLGVQQAAKKHGYNGGPFPAPRPRRLSRRPGHLTIAALTSQPEACEPYRARQVRLGAESAAARLGYHFQLYRSRVGTTRNRVLEPLLRETRTAGILLLPMASTVRAKNLLDWDAFSVVAATDHVARPVFDRVIPDHFENTLLAIRQLVAHGRRKVGVYQPTPDPSRHRLPFSAAVDAFNLFRPEHPLRCAVFDSARALEGLPAWFDKEKPDAVVAADDDDADEIAEALGPERSRDAAFVVLHHVGMPSRAGVDPCYPEIGETAMLHLHALIQSGRKGAPTLPSTISLLGRWVDALALHAPG